MPRVYVETSVPSFYHDTRRTVLVRAWREATRAWWAVAERSYELVTSDFVMAELRETPEPKRTAALALMDGVVRLPIHARTARVIDAYIANRLMPDDALGDAAHLAVCSLHGVEFLATWNCKHLATVKLVFQFVANANKFAHIARVNARLGLATPILATPLSLMQGGAS